MKHLAGIAALIGFCAFYEQRVNGGAEWLQCIAGGSLLVLAAILAIGGARRLLHEKCFNHGEVNINETGEGNGYQVAEASTQEF